MKIYSFFIFSVLCIFLQINFTESRKNDQTNIVSYLKDRLLSTIEEYQESYQSFLYLMKTLKYHFYDNYNQQPQQYKLVKRETNRKRTLYNDITLVNLIQPIIPIYSQLFVMMLVNYLIQLKLNTSAAINLFHLLTSTNY